MKYILFSNNTLLRTKINDFIAPEKCIFKQVNILQVVEKELEKDDVLVVLDERYREDNFETLTQLLCYPKVKILQLAKNLQTDIMKLNNNVYFMQKPTDKNFTTLVKALNILIKKTTTLATTFLNAKHLLNSMVIGESKRIQKVKKDILDIYKTNSTILLLGETGCGKDLVAKAIHTLRFGKQKDMVSFNCAFLNDSLSESRLLGFKKGSFTGAEFDTYGILEQGENNSIYFDEIETLKPSIQSFFLRILNDHTYYRIGETIERHFNSQMMFSSNENISKLEKKGKMRKDFIMRITQEVIEIPTLNERLEDIPILINYFEHKHNYEARIKNYDLFMKHDWAGNIRELEDTINRVHIRDPEHAIPMPDAFNKFLCRNTPSARITLNI